MIKPMKTKLIHRCTFEMNIELDWNEDEMLRLICNHDKGGHDMLIPRFAHTEVSAKLKEFLIEQMKIRNLKLPT